MLYSECLWGRTRVIWASQVVLVVKNPPTNGEDKRDVGSIPASGRSPGEAHGNPLQYSCLENPMDRRAWWAVVHSVTKSQTQLKQLSMHANAHVWFRTMKKEFHPHALLKIWGGWWVTAVHGFAKEWDLSEQKTKQQQQKKNSKKIPVGKATILSLHKTWQQNAQHGEDTDVTRWGDRACEDKNTI